MFSDFFFFFHKVRGDPRESSDKRDLRERIV